MARDVRQLDWRIRIPDPNSRKLLLRLRKANREESQVRYWIESIFGFAGVIAVLGVLCIPSSLGILRIADYGSVTWQGSFLAGLALAAVIVLGMLGWHFLKVPTKVTLGAAWGLWLTMASLAVFAVAGFIEPEKSLGAAFLESVALVLGGHFLAHLLDRRAR